MFLNPLISVVVPTHNRAHLVGRTIDSILSQSYQDIELIVVSDGSTDNTSDVVSKYKDPRVLYFERQKGEGCASARNYGATKASGFYIAFCDDDDVWLPEKLVEQLSCLKSNPEASLCYTNMSRFDESREWECDHEGGYANFETLLNFNNIAISSVLLKKDLFDEVGGFSLDSRLGPAEDYEFLLRLAWKYKFCWVDKPLIKYWSGSARMTQLDEEENLKSISWQVSCIFSSYKAVYKKYDVKLGYFFLPALKQLYCAFKRLVYLKLQKIKSFFAL